MSRCIECQLAECECDTDWEFLYNNQTEIIAQKDQRILELEKKMGQLQLQRTKELRFWENKIEPGYKKEIEQLKDLLKTARPWVKERKQYSGIYWNEEEVLFIEQWLKQVDVIMEGVDE